MKRADLAIEMVDSAMSLDAPVRLPPIRPRAPTRRKRRSRQLINRELSWIDFDRRVLELTADSTLPLLERVRFCAIASSNLDEFFAVRMAELEEQAAAGISRTAPDGRTPAQTLAASRRAIVALQETQDALWRNDLRPALDAAGIRLCRPEGCRPRERRALTSRWKQELLPLLTPVAVGPGPRDYTPGGADDLHRASLRVAAAGWVIRTG